MLAIVYFRRRGDGPIRSTEITEQELNELLRGTSVRFINAHHRGFKLSTSDGITLELEARSEGGDSDLLVLDFEGETAIRLNIFADDERQDIYGPPPVVEIEQRLRALRNLYALSFVILEPARIKSAQDGWLSLSSGGDLERVFLDPTEFLRLDAAGTGSFFATVSSVVKSGEGALLTVASLFTPTGRTAFLDRIKARADLDVANAREAEAKARTAEAKARSDELDTLKKEDTVKIERVKNFMKLQAALDKLDEPEREKLKELFNENAQVLKLPPPSTGGYD